MFASRFVGGGGEKTKIHLNGVLHSGELACEGYIYASFLLLGADTSASLREIFT